MTFLASLNMSCHASFVLNGHCLPSAIHGDGLKYLVLVVLGKMLCNAIRSLAQLFWQCTLRAFNTLDSQNTLKNNNAEYTNDKKYNAVSWFEYPTDATWLLHFSEALNSNYSSSAFSLLSPAWHCFAKMYSTKTINKNITSVGYTTIGDPYDGKNDVLPGRWKEKQFVTQKIPKVCTCVHVSISSTNEKQHWPFSVYMYQTIRMPVMGCLQSNCMPVHHIPKYQNSIQRPSRLPTASSDLAAVMLARQENSHVGRQRKDTEARSNKRTSW